MSALFFCNSEVEMYYYCYYESKLLLANINKIKEFHNIHVEIIILSLKQNNLYLSYPSNMQIISQKQLNVDIFSGHGQSSLGQEQSQG